MNVRSMTRAAFVAGMLGLGALIAAPAAHAARNGDAETYVQENANAALRALGDRSTSSTQRRQTFQRLMGQFADMPRIGSFVLGRYAGQLRNDAALRSEWTSTFQEFAMATYEDRFGGFDGSAIRVTGSEERIAGRDVIVESLLQPRGNGTPTRVQWRVLRSGNGWKVVDVSVIDSARNQVWLAQFQQRQFLAELDSNNGNIRTLMTDIRGLTASMRQRARNS